MPTYLEFVQRLTRQYCIDEASKEASVYADRGYTLVSDPDSMLLCPQCGGLMNEDIRVLCANHAEQCAVERYYCNFCDVNGYRIVYEIAVSGAIQASFLAMCE